MGGDAWSRGRSAAIAQFTALWLLAGLYVAVQLSGLISLWLSAALQIAIAMACAHLMLATVRRLYPPHRRKSADNDLISGSFATVGAVYALVLGFVIVVVWQQYSETEATVGREANAVADLERMSHALPVDAQRQVQDAARTYLRLVIHEEWPLMARGATSPRAHAALVELWTVYTDMEAKQHASPLYDRSVTRLNELGDNRRQRLNDAGQSVSPLMWVMLYLGSVLTVVILCLFDADSDRLHRFLTMTLAGMLTLALILIGALQSPFDTHLPITPEMFQAVLDNMRQLEI
ncbi:bestrophin-like domain [Nonomuraea endophytica]|uniref:bestrophin-like domain n=1 Tax=Nonomuraea endophytica TaxID=714136 RepID=UPI0037C62421